MNNWKKIMQIGWKTFQLSRLWRRYIPKNFIPRWLCLKFCADQMSHTYFWKHVFSEYEMKIFSIFWAPTLYILNSLIAMQEMCSHACNFFKLSPRWSNCFILFQVPTIKPMELTVEASPRRIFANAHTYHINSISVNSDQETYLSADDLRINLWHLEITDQSFSILFGNYSVSKYCCTL